MLACVLVRDLPLAVALRDHPPLEAGEVIVEDRTLSPARVVACSPEARALGVHPGMPSRRARALCPYGVFLRHDPEAVREAWEGVLTALRSFTPLLESPEPGLAFLDLGRVGDVREAHRQGRRLVRALVRRAGFRASVGLAGVRFAALVAAREAEPGECLVVPPGEERAFLAPRPVSHLPVREETVRRLDLLGLRTLGHLTDLPASHLVQQFGREGEAMARLARGEDLSLLSALPEREPLTEALSFEAPVGRLETLRTALEGLLPRLFARLRGQGRLCTRVVLVLALGRGGPVQLRVDLTGPEGDPVGVLALLQARLSRLRLPAPVVGLEVRLEGLVPEAGRQGSLMLGSEERRRGLETALRRLRALGKQGLLLRVVWDDPDSRIPERRAHLEEVEG